MLPAERRDPRVIGGDWSTGALQFVQDSRIAPRGLNSNLENEASIQHPLQRPFIRFAMPGLSYPECELPGYDDGYGKLGSLGNGLPPLPDFSSRYAERAFVSGIKFGPLARFVRIRLR